MDSSPRIYNFFLIPRKGNWVHDVSVLRGSQGPGGMSHPNSYSSFTRVYLCVCAGASSTGLSERICGRSLWSHIGKASLLQNKPSISTALSIYFLHNNTHSHLGIIPTTISFLKFVWISQFHLAAVLSLNEILSPVCLRPCICRCDSLKYFLLQPG